MGDLNELKASLREHKKKLNACDRADVEHWERLIRGVLNTNRRQHENDVPLKDDIIEQVHSELEILFLEMIDSTVTAVVESYGTDVTGGGSRE